MGNDGKGFSVVCKKSNNNIAKFELVTDGLVLLQREYPENVRYINATERKTKALELQLFADGGAASTGDAAQAADNAALHSHAVLTIFLFFIKQQTTTF